MNFTKGMKRALTWGGALAVLTALALPSTAGAVPEPGAKGRGFRLFARALGAMTVNRVYCGLNNAGEVCVDSLGSSTIGGGYWPKGTADQYIFNSGLQLAGIVGPDGGDWAGDTTGAFFFDPKGTTVHGSQVTPIYNSADPVDVAGCSDLQPPGHPNCAWPAAAAVPEGDEAATLFAETLRGSVQASQGDIWYLTWEGDPALNAGRPHPLGVLVEVRGLGWNYPVGNNDILYFFYTFYNVTSGNPAAYAGARDAIRPFLENAGTNFQALNEAAFGVDLPDGGYTITDMFAAFARDDDVADAGANYSSVNLPFALGYTYEHTFDGPSMVSGLGWTFEPATFRAPFFAGPGFTAAKYLKSPTGAGAIQLFSNTINGGQFDDAENVIQLYRYLSGNINPAAGDAPCLYDPVTERLCFINNNESDDMRFFQSSTPLELAPGASGTIVVAYIHAPPVALPAFSGDPTADVKPGDPRLLVDPVGLAANGANMIDSLMGFVSYSDLDGDTEVDQNEFVVVPGSTLSKANLAQQIFDIKFLLPAAPQTPEFFLVPGNNEVAIFWQDSPTDNSGDPYFNAASNPLNPDLSQNNIYDANYRQFDVEGYRVYRGRVDNPSELTLLAQYDRNDTQFDDYYGIVNPTPLCAPEFGEETDCPVDFDDIVPGVALTTSESYDLVGEFIQAQTRTPLANGEYLVTQADTAITGGDTGLEGLSDTGIPYVYVDRNVRNGFRYFYAVVAFDVNSIRSGPSSLESQRATKSVVPVKNAANYDLAGEVTSVALTGSGVALNPNAPNHTIDPTNGTFSGPAAPANAWEAGFGDFVARVISEPGVFAARLDSIALGSPYQGVPHNYWFTALSSGTPVATFSIPILQQQEIGVRGGAAQFSAVPLDPDLAALYGGVGDYSLQGRVEMEMDGADYTSLYGRGCVNGRAGFTTGEGCDFNGSRWFDGPSPANNEVLPHPNWGNQVNFSGGDMTVPTNAGFLTGVVNIHNTQAYQQAGGGSYRPIEGIKSGAKRAADFNVTWGAAGQIASVFDVTHNVEVPFDSAVAGGGWGILNVSNTPPGPVGDQSYDRRTELTNTDMGCVEPFRSYRAGIVCGLAGTAPRYIFSRVADPGPVVMPLASGESQYRTAAPQPNNGFLLYLAGDWFTFELAGGAVPAEGTVWTLRTYIGAITGGQNSDGSVNYGDYIFTPSSLRTLSAVGAEIQIAYDVSNTIRTTNNRDLSRVHTVPDPYYVTNPYEVTTTQKIIKFVNLPSEAIIRIYSASGVLVDVIEHQSDQGGGEATWDVRNRNNQVVASGVYFYHIEAGEARKVGRFTVVNFAQ